MNVLLSTLIVLFALESSKAANFSCFNYTPGKLTLPDFPKTYKVFIEIVNTTDKATDKETAYDILELYDDGKTVSTIRRTENLGRFQWIFNHTSKTYSYVEQDYSCNTSVWSKNADIVGSPLIFPVEIQQEGKPVLSLWEIYEYFKTSENITLDKNNTEHDHGIPVDHYIGCSKMGDLIVEYEVCLSEKNFSMPEKGLGQVPTRIELKVYTGTSPANVTVKHNIIYEMQGYRTKLIKVDDDFLLPAPGVFCKGMNNTKEMPKLPQKFSVKIEYTDFPTTSIDSNLLYYDTDRHIAAFEFTSNHTDEPMAVKVDLPKGRSKIVHDFNSGLQYVVDSSKDTCYSTSNLTSISGDVEEVTEGTSQVISMKNIANVLLTPENVSFVYVGMRMSNYVPCDVWIARANDTKPNEYKIYELYIVSSNWSIDNGFGSAQKNLPLTLRVYHGENKNRTISSQHFNDYKVFNEYSPLPWSKLDVLPCLSFVQNYSYLVVQMSGSEEILKKVGYETVKNQLREKLAEKANVSVLRITEFYFQPVPNGLWVFFMLANRSDVAGSKTKWSGGDIDVAKAHENLNASLTAGDLSFTIDKQTFIVQKGSLNLVPPYFHPSNATMPLPVQVPKGYTSGSMAGLGICMLLIGGMVGLGLAFFLWKRNRGIAYQIYE